MISRMDQIYSSASITIIDASGNDAQNGLPGVSSFPRRLQQQVHIGNTTLLELPRGNVEVETSKWATRGWTYQEGYLSPRRLIFTPSQVLYICASTYAEESAYRLLGHDSPQRKNLEFRNLFPGFLHFENELKPLRQYLLGPLMEYSKRNLTYQHDSLNAFLGILNFSIQQSKLLTPDNLHVSWGVFAEYMERDEICIRLDWYHKSTAQRRPQFPSWTWAGWGGPLQFTRTGITLQRPGEELSVLHHLEWQLSWDSNDHMSGNIWNFADHALRSWHLNRGRLLHQPFCSTQLQITCLVVPVSFQEVPLTRDQEEGKTELHFGNGTDVSHIKRLGLPGGTLAVLPIWEGIYIAAETFLDQESDGQDCIVGLLFTSLKRYTRTQFTGQFTVTTFGCLLARRLDEGLYERVGLVPEIMSHYYSPRVSYDNGWLSGCVFLDETGRILDKVKVPEGGRDSPFKAVGERQTIVLV